MVSNESGDDLKKAGRLIPADSREALKWFVESFGLYVGSVRGMVLYEFSEELEASLEAAVISLRSRGLQPLVISSEVLYQQAEYLWQQASVGAVFGRPLASKLELDMLASDVLILTGLEAPENHKQLWYLHNCLLYPRVLAGKAVVITSHLTEEELNRYGAQCDDPDFLGQGVTWSKIRWLLEISSIDLNLFRATRESELPPMLKAELALLKALEEKGLKAIPQYALGDYMLDLALVDADVRLDIECDGVVPMGSQQRQAEEAKRNLVLLADGWQIVRFTSSEVLNRTSECAEAVADLWLSGRKRLAVGRHITGQRVKQLTAELPADDPQQSNAINHGGGPAAVIGGAGTGKTTAMLYRVANLLSEGVNPDSILVLSFSESTANLAKQELEKLVGKDMSQRLKVDSWQGLGMRILKESQIALKRRGAIKIENNPLKVIQRIISRLSKEPDVAQGAEFQDLDEIFVASVISSSKLDFKGASQLVEQATDVRSKVVARVYQGYEEHLRRTNKIDRDDVVALSVATLLENPELRGRYQAEFDYVLADEYQDASTAHDLLTRLIAAPEDNLFLLGDEDEAIHVCRGGRPDLLMDISFRIPQARCYILENNWRSSPDIVDHARQLASKLAGRRMLKEISPGRSACEPVAIFGPQQAGNERQEVEWIAGEVGRLSEGGRPACEIAIIYRHRAYRSLLAEVFSSSGLPCNAPDSASPLVPDELGDILAYLRLVVDPDGPKAKEAFEHVCQLKAKEVDPRLLASIASFAEANSLSFLKGVEIYAQATNDNSCKDLEQLVRLIRTMHNESLPPAETISLIRRTQRLDQYYRLASVPRGVEYEPLRRLKLVEEQAAGHDSVAGFVNSLETKADLGKGSADSVVRIIDVYDSKGMEFPVVFLAGLAEGLFPLGGLADIEEERRLCYLAFTRARDMLYLSLPAEFAGRACPPSRFLVDARLMPYRTPTGSPEPASHAGSGQEAPVASAGETPGSKGHVDVISGRQLQASEHARPSFNKGVEGACLQAQQCPTCGSLLESGGRFCGQCGYRLVDQSQACTGCGLPLEAGAKFCGECGLPVDQSEA